MGSTKKMGDQKFPLLYAPCSMRSSKDSFGRGNPGRSWIESEGASQGSPNSLEYGLNHMMAVSSIEEVDVKGDPPVVTEGPEELLHQFEIKGPDSGPSQFHMKDEAGSHGEIQGHRGQRLIHRGKSHPVSVNPFCLSQGLSNRLSKADAHIFHGMMVIDVEIALGVNGEVHAAVMSKETEHVIEKGDTRMNRISTRSIQVDF